MSAVQSGTRLVEAAVLLTATRLALAASPARLAARLLRRAGSLKQAQSSPSSGQVAADVARDVERVAPLVHGSTCLSRALTGWLMLRRRGVAAVVRVGAQQGEGAEIRMHAWLEVAGAPLIGHEQAAEFATLTR